MERRSLLKLIGATVLAERIDAVEHQLFQIASSPATYRLQFFNPAQNQTVDTLMELIIPADGHSPGAREAKVSYFADLIVANSDKTVQLAWTQGIAAFDADSQRRFNAPFRTISSSRQDEILAAAAGNEAHPASDLDNFFVQLKLMTINGYYTSSIGIHKDLEYKGNTALPDYYGCTHPEHQA
jgi:hypothetical protein